jgi:hypothetical protein
MVEADGRIDDALRHSTVSRWLRTWPLAVALAAFLLHLPYLWPGGPNARSPEALKLGRDEATVLADSLRIARGEVMYRDFFEFQGPVFYHVQAGVMAVTGPSIGAARLVHLLISAAATALLAILVARFAGRWAGVGAATVHAALILPMWPYAYPHWTAEALVLGALVIVAREETRPRDDVIAGALLGLAVLTIQSVGLPALVAVIGSRALPGIAARDRRRALVVPARTLAGAAAAIGIVCLYFTARGALDEMWHDLFVWPLDHYEHGNKVAYGYALDALSKTHDRLSQPWELLGKAGLRLVWLLPIAAAIGALAVAPVALWRAWRKNTDPIAYAPAICAGASLAAVTPVLLGKVNTDITHISFVASFGLVSIAAAAAPAVARWRHARIAAAALFCLLGASTLASYGHKLVRTRAASAKLGSWQGEALDEPQARRLASIVPPGERIVAGNRSGYYYLYVAPPAVSHTYVPHRYDRYLSAEQWQKLADEIATRRPYAMFLGKDQWSELARRRAEIRSMYRDDRGIWIRVESAGTTPPSSP